MSALASYRFRKMNGLGNEIVVVDMRGEPQVITAADIRAAAASVRFDQMMVLYPGRVPETDAFVRIYNTDGSEAGACGNGMRCAMARLADNCSRLKGLARHSSAPASRAITSSTR